MRLISFFALPTGKVRSWAILGLLAAFFGLVTTGNLRAEDRKTKIITYASSAAYTAGATNSSGFLVDKYHECVLIVNITAVSGTPTLDIDVQTSDDNSTYYFHTRLDTIRVTGQTAFKITNFGKYVRVRHTVAGSTSLTYTIKGVFKN